METARGNWGKGEIKEERKEGQEARRERERKGREGERSTERGRNRRRRTINTDTHRHEHIKTPPFLPSHDIPPQKKIPMSWRAPCRVGRVVPEHKEPEQEVMGA